MDFKHSHCVDAEPFDGDDLHGNIALRCHLAPIKEDIGTVRCQDDWKTHVAPLPGYRGGLGKIAGFMQVTVPECLPERLEIISYANELAFLYDGMYKTTAIAIYTSLLVLIGLQDATENINDDDLLRQNKECQDTFKACADGASLKQKAHGVKYLQAKVFAEMKAIDKPRAIETMRAWNIFLEDAAGKRQHEHFKSLDEYNEYRLMDCGEMYWYGVVTFGMGLTIPDEDQAICRELAKASYIVLGLTNDLYSWDKERACATEMGQEHVVNALYVIQNLDGCSAEEAKAKCRRYIKDNVAAFEKIVADNKSNEKLALDTRKYLEALLYSISGNVYWSCVCPRYHPSEEFSVLQQDMMKFGSEEGLRMHGYAADGTLKQVPAPRRSSWLSYYQDVFTMRWSRRSVKVSSS